MAAEPYDDLDADEAGQDFRDPLDDLPLGTVDFAWSSSNVTLSTTAGTYSDIVVGATFTPAATGRRYKITYAGGDNLVIGGSGFTTSDTWLMKIQVSVAGGAYADVQGPWYITRAQVAQTMRYAIPPGEVNYVAASGSTLRFKAAATKSIGASSVTQP